MALIGMDIGTTYCAVVTLEHGRPSEIYNREGDKTTPSVVFFPPHSDDIAAVVVGRPAVAKAATAPERVVRLIKRQMGTTFVKTIGERSYTPVEVTAVIIRKLLADAAQALDEPVGGAVITVPAHFGVREREDTKRAAELAGVRVLAVIAEPVAAAIDFTHSRGEKLAGKTVLVYDLGGGTFDATLLRVNQPGGDGTPLVVEVVGKAGSRELGGADFDDLLARHVAAEFAAAYGSDPLDDPATYDTLLDRCRTAKEDLSTSEDTIVQCHHDGRTHTATVTRATFASLIASRLEETIDKMRELVAELGEKTAGDPRPISWATIDHILMTGGSSRIPQVKELIQAASGKTPVVDRNPDLNVARGAAYLAFSPDAWTDSPAPDPTPGLPGGAETPVPAPTAPDLTDQEKRDLEDNATDVVVVVANPDVVNDCLGVLAFESGTRNLFNDILIRKGQPLPAEQTLCPDNARLPPDDPSRERLGYATAEDGQTAVRIQVTLGDSRFPEEVEIVGTLVLSDIPAGPKGQPIGVTLTCDRNGLIVAEATHWPTGKRVASQFDMTRLRR
jgi:molecular chaperone DnaK